MLVPAFAVIGWIFLSYFIWMTEFHGGEWLLYEYNVLIRRTEMVVLPLVVMVSLAYFVKVAIDIRKESK